MADPQKQDDVSGRDEVVRVICDKLAAHNAQNIELTAETDMTTDLSIDSVAVMDLMFDLEEYYDIAVPLNALVDVYTIGELADLVQKLREAQ